MNVPHCACDTACLLFLLSHGPTPTPTSTPPLPELLIACMQHSRSSGAATQAYVPLGPQSLKMGTRDGGRTVVNDSPRIDAAAQRAAERLRLRGHVVAGHKLFAAADVEGHMGEDSR